MGVTERQMISGLYREEVEVPFDFEAAEPDIPFAEGAATTSADSERWTLRAVRNMLVRLRQLEHDAAQLGEVKAEIVDSYDHQIQTKERQASVLRQALQSILERGPFGPRLTFPDAGKVHLSTAGGNLVLANQEAAVTAYGFNFTKPTTDVAAMNTWARDLHKRTGEVPKGYVVAPKRKTLVVSKP